MSGTEDTTLIRKKLDNNNMNTIKFTNHNIHGVPQNAIIKRTSNIPYAPNAREHTEVLSKCQNTRYYDKADKTYRTWPVYYKINNETYA